MPGARPRQPVHGALRSLRQKRTIQDLRLGDGVLAVKESVNCGTGLASDIGDPDDEPLVQLAVESGARRVVTHNVRDLQPAATLGVEVLSPRDFLAKLQE